MPRLLLLVPNTSYRAEEFGTAARRLGIEVSVASERASSLAGQRPADLLALDFARPEVAVRQARRFHSRYPVDAVLGVDDATVEAAAHVAAALGLPHNPPEAVARARSKLRTREALREAGTPVPWFRCYSRGAQPDGFAEEVPYPCVLKPLGLSGGQGVIRADDPRELAAAFERVGRILDRAAPQGAEAGSILIESFIPGREVALDGLLTAGELQVLCLWDKPDPLDGPYFEETIYVTPSRLPEAATAEIVSRVREAARVLGLREGPVHAELRVNDEGAWLLELNPRSIGGKCSRALRFGAGLSLEELILRHALRMEIPSLERERAAAGVMMLPIPRAGVLEEVRGEDEALAVFGIRELILSAHPGQELVPLPEGSAYLGFLFARGASPTAVETALREAHSRLEVVVRPVAEAGQPR
ncbi:MAG: ATP-grasp domain-containing protein [Armatimonadota bacterium]